MTNDFTSKETRRFQFVLGSSLASALSGFVAGVVASTIVWIIAFQMFQGLFQR